MISQGTLYASKYPGMDLKAWVFARQGAFFGTIVSQFNVALTSATGAGAVYTFPSPMPDANYIISVGEPNSFEWVTFGLTAKAAGGFTIIFRDAAGAQVHPQIAHISVYR